ncbi:MAG: carbohydrate kinase family protein [Aggregatilineaceae bacterium]
MTTPPEFDFVGVGGIACDLVLRVERLPLDDDKVPAQWIGRLPGGFIANATCAAARLGLRTAYAGWVGDDADGRMLIDSFAEFGVQPLGLARVPGEQTPFTLVITDAGGRRAILLPAFPLYEQPLAPEQLALAKRARVVYTFPRDAAWCAQLHDAARQGGGLFVLDVEAAVPLRGETLREAIRLADVFFVAESALKGLGLSPLEGVMRAGQWAVVTAGARGAYGLIGGQQQTVFQPAFRVPVIDSTGAGDCFHAALLAARLDGAALPEALAFASAAAALKVQHEGARGGLPTRAQIEALRRTRQ